MNRLSDERKQLLRTWAEDVGEHYEVLVASTDITNLLDEIDALKAERKEADESWKKLCAVIVNALSGAPLSRFPAPRDESRAPWAESPTEEKP
jgi:hypothetical protein